ncbi:hypothetical protein LOTGIDRAFT_181619 [Lottia gigantea]|uniref:Metalloendopeptidase n=1 Tax=Lottia gigantea TaxID=225164 RepID=V4AKL7_LOTGI|nr:hypothetical protein LOTGIDRAFT_181619 [Lottia gigantea]ESO97657.1 hypothetical protein LOTGIDRAFT_181619 [Lottia gigantea]
MKNIFGVMVLATFIFLTNGAPTSSKEDTRSLDEILMDAMTQNNNVEMLDLFHDLGDGKMMAMVELDILLNRTELAQYRSPANRHKRKAYNNLRLRWPNNQVPYQIQETDFSSRDISTIRAGIKDWEDMTCLTFNEVPRNQLNQNPSRILFRNGDGCYSRLGRTGTVQPISLGRGCRTRGIVVHEIGHAIGWIHEQARPDRDDFITVNFNQIPPKWQSQYSKRSPNVINDFNVEYDYTSIMHYSANSFGPRTIVTKDPAFQNLIGQRQALSFRDVKLANLMYSCAAECTRQTCPGEGFQGKDCRCYCPMETTNIQNPVKLCDMTATTRRTIRTTTPSTTTTTQSTVKPPPECRDILLQSRCESLRDNEQCRRDPERLMVYCKKTCNFCDEDPNKMCMDFDNACPFIASSGYCNSSFSDLVRETCPKSCKVCIAPSTCALDMIESLSPRINPSLFSLLFVFMAIFIKN